MRSSQVENFDWGACNGKIEPVSHGGEIHVGFWLAEKARFGAEIRELLGEHKVEYSLAGVFRFLARLGKEGCLTKQEEKVRDGALRARKVYYSLNGTGLDLLCDVVDRFDDVRTKVKWDERIKKPA